jgi:leucyl-tRNA synthetase
MGHLRSPSESCRSSTRHRSNKRRDATEEQLEALAMALDNVQKALEGKTLVKVIWVPAKMLELVVK